MIILREICADSAQYLRRFYVKIANDIFVKFLNEELDQTYVTKWLFLPSLVGMKLGLSLFFGINSILPDFIDVRASSKFDSKLSFAIFTQNYHEKSA